MAIPKIISPKTQILDVITRGDSNGLSDLLLSPSLPDINRLLDGVRLILRELQQTTDLKYNYTLNVAIDFNNACHTKY